MTVARHYLMKAAAGQEEALGKALRDLVPVILTLEGCVGCELLGDVKQPGEYIFIEKWASVEAHKAAGSPAMKDALKPVMGALGSPPEGRYLEYQFTA